MKKYKRLRISVIALTVLLLLLCFEWVNVESYYEDQAFIGNNVSQKMHSDILIIKALLLLDIIMLVICIYKLNKAYQVSDKKINLQ